MSVKQVEYIWLDGTLGDPQLRSKTRFVEYEGNMPPQWSFDGGSTFQGSLKESDKILIPVSKYNDPFAPQDNAEFVFCEVFNPDGSPHYSNTRQDLTGKMEQIESSEAWFGFEQEYTLMTSDQRTPLAWETEFPPDKQEYSYCGVGAKDVTGRGLAHDHARLCAMAGIRVVGINAEVMPGQWEYQTAPAKAIKAADDLWVSRYILLRLAEMREVGVSFDPKPLADWNGAGLHTNFSTKETREKTTGMEAIGVLLNWMKSSHEDAIGYYGLGIERRLTGKHETSDPKKFTSGVADRGASVRIPSAVEALGCGYLEDRRPCANADPYLVCSYLMDVIDVSFKAEVRN